MQTANIFVKYVNPPKDGRKFGSIKDGEGQYWSLPPALLSQIQAGQQVVVNFETTPEGYRNIKSLAAPPAPPPQTQAKANGATHGGHNNDRAIFITGIVGRALGSGKFGISDVKLLAFAAADAYDELKQRDMDTPPFE